MVIRKSSDDFNQNFIRPKRVLFVCVENSFRSQIAEAFAHIYGGDYVMAYSAGSKPLGEVHPKAVATMKEIDYDLTRHSSKSLAEISDVQYDVAVTMGCGDECPLVRALQRESWDIQTPRTWPRRTSWPSETESR